MKNFMSKSIGPKILLGCAALLLLLLACKTEAATETATEATPEIKTYKVTIDANGGSGFAPSYTVKEGDTLTITDTISGPNKYNSVKDYINTSGNTVFTMGSTKVNGDIHLKVEWLIDLNKVLNMLAGKWDLHDNAGSTSTFTFTRASDSSLDVKINYYDGVRYNSPDNYVIKTLLEIGDSFANATDAIKTQGNNFVAKFSSRIQANSFYYYIGSLTDTELVLLSDDLSVSSTLTKQQ